MRLIALKFDIQKNKQLTNTSLSKLRENRTELEIIFLSCVKEVIQELEHRYLQIVLCRSQLSLYIIVVPLFTLLTNCHEKLQETRYSYWRNHCG